jgi:23S rRNA pseudouridine2605 synthase
VRINQYIASATGISRRAADQAIIEGRVSLNCNPAQHGNTVAATDLVTFDGQPLTSDNEKVTIMLNKPVGYVVSRDGQGSQTIYDLLPPKYHSLKPVGRLDKDSSGLLLLTNDGQLANELTHPRYSKTKVYEIELDKPLRAADQAKVEQGVKLDDGLSRLQIKDLDGKSFTVIMTEGRNRQIRRTFDAVGYDVRKLHRTEFGRHKLGQLPSRYYQIVPFQK